MAYNNNSFENNPKLHNIDPMKLKIIMEIKQKSKTKSLEDLLPEIMKINKELERRNMNFTSQEQSLLIDALTESMTPDELKKFNMIKGFLI